MTQLNSDKYSIKSSLHHLQKYMEHDYSSLYVTANSPIVISVLCGVTRWQKASLAKCFGEKHNVI